ncbi:hypothetical protein Ssi02_39590 [Sinosporangium siamense]|uniref:histidine kinase n=1 Tax=Sinosporangium siamense TaxID=1367973 RepID=A0A919RHJ2_9ACTN|nr:hypothetical protein Ssi02_39590 [Sinosporangium siamense]
MRLVSAVPAALVGGRVDPPVPRRPGLLITLPGRLFAGRRIDLVFAADVLAALVLTVVSADELMSRTPLLLNGRNPGSGLVIAPFDLERWLLPLLFGVLPLILRTRWPLGAWRLSVIAMVLFWNSHPTSQIYYPIYIVISLCVYSVAVRCKGEITAVVCVLTTLTTLTWNSAALLPGIFLFSLIGVFGHTVRVRRSLEGEAERAEEAEAARAVLEERSRIARELHDVVAHHMSVIAIQAEAAPLRAAGDPRELEAGLKEIRSMSLEALAEMRRVLGVLRDEEGRRDTAPQPDLRRLPELVVNARAAGLSVTASSAGDIGDLPASVGLSAYRIVQESLSNAMRHAPGSAVTLTIERGSADLLLRIENGPPATPPEAAKDRAGPGHGLIGMVERATMLGGTLMARPTPGGGFAVTARLPIADEGVR